MLEKGIRKVQGVPQSQTAALLRHKEEQETDKAKQAQIEQAYEGPAKSFVAGFGLFQCYVLSNIFLLQSFKVFLLY